MPTGRRSEFCYTVCAVFLCAMLALSANVCGGDTASGESIANSILPALQTHCSACHSSGGDAESDLSLDQISHAGLEKDPDLVQRLIEALDFEAMPPEDQPPLEPALRRHLVESLKTIRRQSIGHQKSFPHAPVRRMNRFQYNNAVIDLFDLRCIVFTLPERMMREHNGYFQPASGKMADVVTVGSRPLGKSQMIEPRLAGVAAFPQDLRAEHGFDNQGDHLSLSPLLMESFLKLGQSITQSPDFGPRNVGCWNEFFAPPKQSAELEAEIHRRLDPFLSRAFRQTVNSNQLDRYSDYVLRQIESGATFTDAMKSIAAATISSPKFLYLYDRDSDDASAQPIDGFELASRLSFFLWGSLPDTELLRCAADGELTDPDTLQQQLTRMLGDRKLKRFCDSFPSQWLQLERIISSVPDRDQYASFYFAKYRNSMHMMLEPLLIFETVLIENQPITQLIDSDFTYRSNQLQDAYQSLDNRPVEKQTGRSGAVGPIKFYRFPVTDRRNGGVITNAAVMTMTSGPKRTQPITRGAWMAGVIFNNPPEPPPADVPALDEKPVAGEEHLTLRERLSLHRERSDCKGCHEQIDPLGFALENYDPIGVWRQTYENGRQVDMSGTLFRKHAFHDVVEFKDAILAEKNRFARGLAAHLLSFALARPLGAADQIALDKIVDATAADDYRMQTLIRQVALSEPFLSKSNPSMAGE
ncbi:DUF1592 domain-containing protein [Stieleria sp. TO1_6]|nr:DUF1592 domain-containing protein [Stieleria tagensis]